MCPGSSDQTQGLLASILRFLSELGPFSARLLLGLQSQPGGCSPPPRAPVRPTQAPALCLWEREERRETERASPVCSAFSSGFRVPARLFTPLAGFLPVSRRLPSATSSCHLCPVPHFSVPWTSGDPLLPLLTWPVPYWRPRAWNVGSSGQTCAVLLPLFPPPGSWVQILPCGSSSECQNLGVFS